MKLSIIVPALNEADCIGETLKAAEHGVAQELIVVDGGSEDGTQAIVQAHDAHVITSPPGRGEQLQRGVEASTGDTLLFLHADSLLPTDYDRHIERVLSAVHVSGGAFRLSIRGGPPGTRIIERIVQFRSRVLQMPYGDQALFARRSAIEQVGGIPREPIMEDVMLVRRLKRIGRIGLADVPVQTSGRRWRKKGVILNTLQNQLTFLAFQFGVSPDTLWSLYHE
jgi:rSAM/selenodomain-associated transferase 2